mmetsp:Transcript_6199/g.9844  ORF Transcript_6199/g.9844 Transcript_6199/m.9844 type:complete len:213 (-) Transcript_6199:47-685(-)
MIVDDCVYLSERNLSRSGSQRTFIGMSDDEVSLCSIKTEDIMDQGKKSILLEQYLQSCDMTKSYTPISNERFVFQHESLSICASIRNNNNRKAIDFSCTVYSVSNNLSKLKEYRPTSYSLLTKMMKYKSIFQLSDKRQQIGICDGKFLYIRSVSASLLEKKHFEKLSCELEDFFAVAAKMSKDFFKETLQLKATKGLEQLKSQKTGRSRSCC